MKKVPFFAKYLETQQDEKAEKSLPVKSGVKAGRPISTLKYPSDRDEVVTMKYPSDGDDDVVRY